MKTLFKIIMTTALLAGSTFASVATATSWDQAIQGKVDSCRIHADGRLQVYFATNTQGYNCAGGSNEHVIFKKSVYTDNTIAAFHANCIAAKVSDRDLRVDYLACVNGQNELSNNTSVQLK